MQVDDGLAMAPDFEVFHREHRDRLVASLALHLGDVHLASDAVDHAMAKAWTRWERLDDHDDAGAWVYGVARNWATSWLRRLRFRSNRAVPERASGDPLPSDLLDDDPALRRALASLTDGQRAVVVLRLLQEMSTREVALALDVEEGTVTSRLSRARRQLRDALTDTEAEQ